MNGNIKNQGLGTVTHISGTPAYKTNGKIGGYCCDLNTAIRLRCNELNGLTKFTIMFWVKIEDNANLTSNWNRVFMVTEEKADSSATGLLRCETCYGSSYATTSPARGTHWHDNTNYAITNYGPNMYTSADRGIWHHVAFAVDTNNGVWAYTDGSQIGSSTTVYGGHLKTDFYLGDTNNISGCINDVRIYDYVLSPREIKEISKGLVLHYTLSNAGGDNLLIGSPLHITASDLANGSSTDWTIPVRYYNGGTNYHNFSDGIDTISLKASGNIGIAFIRKATDINLDSSSYYTLSCEAKCTKSGAGLDTGLSYYTTADTWVWRGGTNRKLFKSVNEWQKFSLTFKPDADTQYICYCFTIVGETNGTDTFSIKNCKLEKGTIDTPWIPNPADPEYTKMGYNNNIEYDVSGFKNNGTKVGALTYSSDTPKYWTSTYFTSGTYINAGKGAKVTDAITVNLWVNIKTYGGPISCTEGGGWNFEQSGGYIRFPVYVSSVGYVVAQSPSITVSSLQNNWHMLTGTYDRSNVKLYVDGVLQATVPPSTTGRDIAYNTNNVVFISGEAAGNDTTPAESVYTGSISDVRIYATALSADDILELYHTPVTLTSNGVLMTSGEFTGA